MQQLAGEALPDRPGSGAVLIATLHLEERLLRAFVGGAADRAEIGRTAGRAGSIRISAETYACVQDAVGSVASWMLASNSKATPWP